MTAPKQLSAEEESQVGQLFANGATTEQISAELGIDKTIVSAVALKFRARRGISTEQDMMDELRADLKRTGALSGSPSVDQAEVLPPLSAESREIKTRVRELAQERAGGVRRINVNFSEQAYQTLEGLARQSGKSMSDVLRDAIALKSWFDQTRAEGGHVLVERPDGKVREVISV